jgi:beta-lactamase regulating signal transducer with metallopeptidase domain
LLWLWLAGVLVFGLRLFLANWCLSRLLKRGVWIREKQVLGLLENCARLMRVRKAPMLVATPHFDSPAVFGCFRPTLLLPARLTGAFSSAELRHIFLHELAHIRRGDSAMNWLLACLQTIHWFNPLLRYGFHRMQADRELACDALVLARMGPAEGHSYGRTILKLLESLTQPAAVPGLVGILEEKQQMKRRMEMITQNARTPGRPLLAVLLLAALAMFTLTDTQTAAPANAPGEAPDAEATTVKPIATAPSQELLAQESEIDRQHLQRIYKAIQAYYKDRRDLPNWLSDLVPQYLPDAAVLISPVETRTGKSVLFGREDPKIHTSYIYEFNAGPAAEQFNRGRSVPLTCKEWKLMQLPKFGLVTPLLRCHLDKPVLNVAYCGVIYETGLLWEDDPNTAALIKENPLLGPRAGAASGPELKVRVVDADTGAPVSSAAVRNAIGAEFGLLPPGQGTTDADGNVTVNLGEWKVNWLFLTAASPLYYTRGLDWNRDTANEEAPPAQITLKMSRKDQDQ